MERPLAFKTLCPGYMNLPEHIFSCANRIIGMQYGLETKRGTSTAHSARHTGGVQRKMPAVIGKGGPTAHVSCMGTFCLSDSQPFPHPTPSPFPTGQPE